MSGGILAAGARGAAVGALIALVGLAVLAAEGAPRAGGDLDAWWGLLVAAAAIGELVARAVRP